MRKVIWDKTSPTMWESKLDLCILRVIISVDFGQTCYLWSIDTSSSSVLNKTGDMQGIEFTSSRAAKRAAEQKLSEILGNLKDLMRIFN